MVTSCTRGQEVFVTISTFSFNWQTRQVNLKWAIHHRWTACLGIRFNQAHRPEIICDWANSLLLTYNETEAEMAPSKSAKTSPLTRMKQHLQLHNVDVSKAALQLDPIYPGFWETHPSRVCGQSSLWSVYWQTILQYVRGVMDSIRFSFKSGPLSLESRQHLQKEIRGFLTEKPS